MLTGIGPTVSEETLVADVRHGLSPVQRVEEKLLALLRGGHPGLFHQAACRTGDVQERCRAAPQPAGC